MIQMRKQTLLAGAAVISAVGLAALFFNPTDAIRMALADLRGADPGWLLAAGAAFLAASLASAAAWHRGLRACGARLGRTQVTQRYAAGSLANTFAPANAGEVVRVALLSRAMGSEGSVFTVIGVSAAVAVMRVTVVAALFVATAASSISAGRVGLAIGALALAACGLFLARRRLSGKVRHVLDVARGLAAEPRAALEMVGWVAACTGATILASACVGAALGVPHALAAALVIVPAMELAKLLPITPGNVGLTSAAVAIALHAHGVPLEAAVAAGITLHAVETVVGLAFGAAGTLSLTPAFQRRPRPLVWLRPRLAWALPGAPAAVLVGVIAWALGAYVPFT
jgi:glycosyltransferase 2 family protein